MTPNTRKPKFIKTVRIDWQASSLPPPQPPDEEKVQAILPSTFIQCSAMTSSQKRFIFQERMPMFVGLPTAFPRLQDAADETLQTLQEHLIPQRSARAAASRRFLRQQ